MIHLYVEHLLNIRTLSIQASLSTISNKESKATLSADGNILTLAHEGEVASVQLPITISPNQESDATLTIPAVRSTELSFRIQVEEKPEAENKLLGNRDRESGNIVPWTANSLTDQTEICCHHCDSVLVERGKIRTWKDLPSEGWAEMMEFWHCHKPHEPHDRSNGEVKKAYGTDSRLAVNSSVGLVDVIDFLFVPEDCTNISVGYRFFLETSSSIFSHVSVSTFAWTGQKEPALSRRKANFTGRQPGYNEPKIKQDSCAS